MAIPGGGLFESHFVLQVPWRHHAHDAIPPAQVYRKRNVRASAALSVGIHCVTKIKPRLMGV